MNNICCIFNIAPHYRSSIYRLMDQKLKCDFYIGDKELATIKLMDYNDLNGFKKRLNNISILRKFFWQKGAIKTVFMPYQHYILYGSPFYISTWFIIIVAKILNKKVYSWSHGWYGRESKMRGFIKRIFYNLCYHNLVYGNYARNLMIGNGISSTKISCIYNSLDYDEQKNIAQTLNLNNIYSLHFNNDYPTFIYVGRIQRIKRIDKIIEAIAILKNSNKNCNLVIVGKLAEDVNLDAVINSMEIKERIWLYGPCYDEEVLGNLFFNACACVSPGNVGLTAIHSFSFGCPVITHNNFAYQGPEFEAIKDGVTGSFFEYNDFDSMKDKMEYWLAKDNDERKNIVDKTKNVIDKYYNPHYQVNLLNDLIKP